MRTCYTASAQLVDPTWRMRQVAGTDLFGGIDQQQWRWTCDRSRPQFARQAAAVVEGLSAMTCSCLCQVRTIVAGGSNTEFVSVSTLTKLTGWKIVAVPEGRPKPSPDLTLLPRLEAAANWRD